MSVPSSKTINLGFLAQDIRNQIAHARGLIETAEELKRLAGLIPEGELKTEAETIADRLIQNANDLIKNAENTTASTNNAVTTFSRSST